MTEFVHQYEVGRLAHMQGKPWDETKSTDWQAGWEEEESRAQERRQ